MRALEVAPIGAQRADLLHVVLPFVVHHARLQATSGQVGPSSGTVILLSGLTSTYTS